MAVTVFRLLPSIRFSLRVAPQKTFFRSSRKFFVDAIFFRRRENFGKTRSGRCDRFRPKIFKIRAIPTIFEPLQAFLFGNDELSCLEMTHRPGADTDPKSTTWLEAMASWALKERARKMTDFKGYDRYVWSYNIFRH